MHAKCIVLFASLVYLHAAYAQAEPTKAAAAAQPPASQTAVTAAPSATSKAPKSAAEELASRPEPWRYQWHNNHWWFYTPQDTWLYYNTSGWHPYVPPTTTYWTPSARSRSTQKRVDPGHSLDTVGNYPRYWLWQRLGN